MIKFLDIARINSEFKKDFLNTIQDKYESEYWINGKSVSDFENRFSNYLGVNYTVGVSNGYDALRLCLILKGIREGDEVLVPSFTFIATWLAVTSLGAKPIPVDVNSEDLTISIDGIMNSISPRTKAIIPVHIFGRPCDLDQINNIAKDKNLTVIEDCAQAHGSFYNSKLIGNSQNLCAWSFYPGKNLGAIGDAGAISCTKEDEYIKLKALSNYGSSKKYIHDYMGCNTRLDSLQALFLLKKLAALDSHNLKRKSQANIYFSHLKDIPEIQLLPRDNKKKMSSWHLFVIRTTKRNQLQEYLLKNNIQTLIHYPVPLRKQKAFSHINFDNFKTPVGDSSPDSLLSLPLGPHLENGDIHHVSEIIKKFYI